MSDAVMDAQVAGAMAYEELHVPALFRDWVDPVLDAARVDAGQRVLDVACGTGVLARGALERVGPTGLVIGVDPGPGMLAVAERIEPSIQWRRGSAESLPVDDASVDAVVSQFGMMFFTDRRRAVSEMLRVLEGGGRLAVAVWDSLENSPAFSAEVALLEEIAGPEAAEALRLPFVLGDPAEVTSAFEAAGADGVQVTTRTGTARYPSIAALVGADLRGWLPLMGVPLPEAVIERVLAEAERALAPFVTGEGLVFDASGHVVSGTKP